MLKDRKNLIYLNSHRYCVSYCLCCPDTSRQTYGMRCPQELFFRLGGLRWGTLQIAFVTKKEHNFQTDENIALLNSKRKKKRLFFTELTQVFCGLLSNYFYAKIKCISATLQYCCFLSRHTTPFIPRWRENALRDETK